MEQCLCLCFYAGDVEVNVMLQPPRNTWGWWRPRLPTTSIQFSLPSRQSYANSRDLLQWRNHCKKQCSDGLLETARRNTVRQILVGRHAKKVRISIISGNQPKLAFTKLSRSFTLMTMDEDNWDGIGDFLGLVQSERDCVFIFTYLCSVLCSVRLFIHEWRIFFLGMQLFLDVKLDEFKLFEFYYFLWEV